MVRELYLVSAFHYSRTEDGLKIEEFTAYVKSYFGSVGACEVFLGKYPKAVITGCTKVEAIN